MQNALFKKVWPHLLAILFFLVVSALFCLPTIEGNELDQHDNVSWKGMAQNSFEYKAAKGHFPLWNPNLFSGMPNYQVAMEGKTILPDLTKIVSLGLPKPMNYFFLACVCFYFLALVLRANPMVASLVAAGYGFSTYNAVIIAAGHDTQMIATSYLPVLLAGLLLTYQKKYWLGLSISTLGAYLLIAANHLQITYYFFLVAFLISIAYAIDWIVKKEWKHLFLSTLISVTAASLAVGANALILLTSSEYSRYTMRGGKDVSIDDTGKIRVSRSKGLDTAYAFEYSLAPKESFTLLLPNAYGGGHGRRFEEGSAFSKRLTANGVEEGNAEQIAQSLPQYWGGLPYTAGPAYLGVILVVLAIVGIFNTKGPLRWGLLAATLLGIAITWGKNFAFFNLFLFENLPLFNKFRAPSMAQVIPQLCLSAAAVLGLTQLLSEKWSAADLLSKKVFIPVGSLFGLLVAVWLFQSYAAPIDAQIIPDNEFGLQVLNSLKQARNDMFFSQLTRGLLLTLLLGGVLWAYRSKWLASWAALGILVVLSTVELTMTSKEYLPNESYVSADEYQEKNFALTPIDQEIKKDTVPHYRVFNTTTSSFNDALTSYHHRSVGGYHAAKLRIYQDIIEKYLNKRFDPILLNDLKTGDTFALKQQQRILNMLNTRYMIVPSPGDLNQSVLYDNKKEAMGNCWLIDRISVSQDRAATLAAIGEFNLKEVAVIEKSSGITATEYLLDSTDKISLTRFDNDTLTYESSCSNPRFAVMSEIYYPAGWNAYVDGKKTTYYNVNYLLRGIPVPAGKHRIEFIFEPATVKTGNKIMYMSSIVLSLVVLGGLFMAFKTGSVSTIPKNNLPS